MARFVDPTVIALAILLIGLLVLRRRGAGGGNRRARRARLALWILWAAVYVAACPACVEPVLAIAEPRGADLDAALRGKDTTKMAVVVLSAGFRSNVPEQPPAENLDGSSQSRIVTAARVFHEHDFGSIVASGGPEAMSAGMRDLLLRLDVPESKLVLEGRSTNTRESAELTAEILKPKGVTEIVLVTSALHLPRATRYFERAGLAVIPVAADFSGRPTEDVEPTALVPSSRILIASAALVHELLGRVEQVVR